MAIEHAIFEVAFNFPATAKRQHALSAATVIRQLTCVLSAIHLGVRPLPVAFVIYNVTYIYIFLDIMLVTPRISHQAVAVTQRAVYEVTSECIAIRVRVASGAMKYIIFPVSTITSHC